MHRRVLFWAAWIVGGAALAQDHAGQYSQADIERGMRIYGANCSPCHGADGNQVPTVSLRSGKFRHAVSDEDLGRVIAAGIPGTAMPPHKFDAPELTGIVGYIRSMGLDRSGDVAIGEAARGKAVFEGKGGCLSCHRVRGQGSRFAPDLSDVGAIRPPGKLERSLLDPTAAMLPMHRPVRAVTADGKAITGRRLNEDTYSVQLIDREERLVSLMKAELREYAVVKESPMPSYRDKLTAAERADVVAYLLSLKGRN
jgi:putative heme-binding domain-containing protein